MLSRARLAGEPIKWTTKKLNNTVVAEAQAKKSGSRAVSAGMAGRVSVRTGRPHSIGAGSERLLSMRLLSGGGIWLLGLFFVILSD